MMFTRTDAILFILLFIVLMPMSQVFALPLYGLQWDSPTFELYKIETESLGTPELIGQINFGADLTELISASTDKLYTIDRSSNSLVTISADDASVLSSVSIDTDVPTAPRGFDLSPIDGLLYGVFPGLELRTINPLTGTTTFVTNISGAVGIETIAFGSDGTLYAGGNPSSVHPSSHMYTLDTDTGVLDLFGVTGLDIDALTYGSDGFLYGTDSQTGVAADLIRIDPVSGSFVNLGNTGVTGFNGITTATVPEPSTLFLMVLGLAGLGFGHYKDRTGHLR